MERQVIVHIVTQDIIQMKKIQQNVFSVIHNAKMENVREGMERVMNAMQIGIIIQMMTNIVSSVIFNVTKDRVKCLMEHVIIVTQDCIQMRQIQNNVSNVIRHVKKNIVEETIEFVKHVSKIIMLIQTSQ